MRKLHTYLSYLLVSLAAFAVAAPLFAAPITSDQARTAAAKFVASDPIGSAVLKGRTVVDVLDLDGLWVATLSPSGHIIFSGSDLVEPIVGFSTGDFATPDPKSSACLMLEGVRRKSRAAEEAAEESGAASRNAKWEKFLATKTRAMLRAPSVAVSPELIITPPFLQSHYDQLQPYNDFCPIYDSGVYSQTYRGRTPCGCVATAAAQTLRHFRWPARIDKVYQCDHDFLNADGITTTFPIRFDGSVPLDWNAIDDSYASSYVVSNFNEVGYFIGEETRYDMRGKVAESERYPIGRLAMWMDVISQMAFKTNDSSAVYNNVMVNMSDWYTRGRLIALDNSSAYSQLKDDVTNGVPCTILITRYGEAMSQTNGHVVVAHGWAEDPSSHEQYVYLNFGYGGVYDGFYNIASDIMDYSKKDAYVGCYPRAKPQIEPLPKVCETNIVLNWDFPDFYNNNLSGFSVAVSRLSTTTTDFLDNFSDSSGVSSSDDIFVGYDSTYSYDGDLLCAASNSVGTYTFPDSYTLTSASVLTFKILSYYPNWQTFEIQASFNDGEWETVAVPMLNMAWEVEDNNWAASPASWSTERVYLGAHGGETARFRILKGRTSNRYFTSGRILLDDFQVADILEHEEVATYDVTAFERSCILPSLDEGTAYSFTVTPVVSDALVDGESSDPVSCVVAGWSRSAIPGEQTYSSKTFSFAVPDASGVWSYHIDNNPGTMVGDDYVKARFKCSVTATLPGYVTGASELSFDWSSNSFFDDGPETLSVTFEDTEGTIEQVWMQSNSANATRQGESVSLGRFAGKTGKVKIEYSHGGRNYIGDEYGGWIYSPRITHVQVITPPPVEWGDPVEMTDLGTPAILSVSNVVDGVVITNAVENFYRECKIGTTNEFEILCSEHVTNIFAHSSHLALVSDQQVTTRQIGPGVFRVSVDASGISEAQERSRMILTLEATDSYGTKAYKDLSLRFSIGGDPEPVDPLEVTTSTLPVTTNGVPYYTTLEATGGVEPYTWIVANSSGYNESRSANSFSECGSAQGWQTDDSCWKVLMPFEFPFYGSTYSNIWINSNGTLTFDGRFTSYTPAEDVLSNRCMIAVLWRSLSITNGNIYLDETIPGAMIIRWSGMYWHSGGDAEG